MTDDPLDPVFKALASSPRRKLLDLLKGGALSTGDLVAAFPELSRYAVMQHLGVLETAGLVVSQKKGRVRYNHLNAVPIQRVYDRWVSQYAGHWSQALAMLKHSIEAPGKPLDDSLPSHPTEEDPDA